MKQELEEEQAGSQYDDYRFVTKDDLDRLGLSGLVGTGALPFSFSSIFPQSVHFSPAGPARQPTCPPARSRRLSPAASARHAGPAPASRDPRNL